LMNIFEDIHQRTRGKPEKKWNESEKMISDHLF
jgi:hypothetical protein